jgi:hypothetical protein
MLFHVLWWFRLRRQHRKRPGVWQRKKSSGNTAGTCSSRCTFYPQCYLLLRSYAALNPLFCHHVPGFHLSKLISYMTCVALVLPCLFMMMAGGCDTASCTQLSVCAALQARPLPTYGAPFLPSLSGSKLTEAKSPAFCTRSRDR